MPCGGASGAGVWYLKPRCSPEIIRGLCLHIWQSATLPAVGAPTVKSYSPSVQRTTSATGSLKPNSR